MDPRIVGIISWKELGDLVTRRVYWLTFVLELIIVLGVIMLGIAFAAINNPTDMASNSPELRIRVGYLETESELAEPILEDLAENSVVLVPFDQRASLESSILAGEAMAGLVIEGNDPGVDTRVELLVDPARFYSGVAQARLQDTLDGLNEELSKRRFRSLGYGTVASLSIRKRTIGDQTLPVTSPDFVEAMYLMVVPLILLFPILISANMTADSVVGEKESGTLGILMASPASRFELVLGKTLPILGITNLQFLCWIFLLEHNVLGSIRIHSKVPLLIILNIGALLVIAASLVISSRSKSSRESNLYLTILIILFVFPLFVTFGEGGIDGLLQEVQLVKVIGHMSADPALALSELWMPVAVFGSITALLMLLATVSMSRLEPPPSK